VFSRDSSTRGSPIKNGVLDLLTDAELEVLESLGKGKSKAIICVQLRSSKAEIQAHIESIRRKLKFNSEKLLINYATSWVRSSQEMSGNS
jgi:DNA-binding NarL/FixJ family response regulator